MKSQYLLPVSTFAIAICTILLGGKSALAADPTFSCQVGDEERLTTVAKSSNGVEQPVFHWRNINAAATSAAPKQLCNSVAQKLNDYLESGNDVSSLIFKASTVLSNDEDLTNLPAVCVAQGTEPCKLPLFTLNPSGNPEATASSTLDSILDPALQTTPVKSADRGVQSTSYKVNFWDLFSK